MRPLHFAIRQLATLISGVIMDIWGRTFHLADSQSKTIRLDLYAEISSDADAFQLFALYVLSYVLSKIISTNLGKTDHLGILVTTTGFSLANWKIRELCGGFLSLYTGSKKGIWKTLPVSVFEVPQRKDVSVLPRNSHNVVKRLFATANEYMRIECQESPIMFVGSQAYIPLSLANTIISCQETFCKLALFLAKWTILKKQPETYPLIRFRTIVISELLWCIEDFQAYQQEMGVDMERECNIAIPALV